MSARSKRFLLEAAFTVIAAGAIVSCSLILDATPGPADGQADPAVEDLAAEEEDGRVDATETDGSDPDPETVDAPLNVGLSAWSSVRCVQAPCGALDERRASRTMQRNCLLTYPQEH